MTRLFAIVVLLFAARCQAELHDSVCLVSCPPNGGSGTLVAVSGDGCGLVISVAHLFEGGNTRAITCRFPATGKSYPARLLAVEGRYDLAALEIKHPPSVDRPAAIVAATKNDGPFTCVGFPWNSRGRIRYTRGSYIGYAQGGESAYLPSMLHTRQLVISGYSGGARFNRFGEYVGPISGMCGEGSGGMDRCWGASGPALTKFVARFVKTGKP